FALCDFVSTNVNMKRAILLMVVGLLVGAGAAVYFLGAPRAKPMPGVAVGPPNPNPDNSATVTVASERKLFDPLLGTVFKQLGPPQLKLAQGTAEPPYRPAVFQAACTNVVMLAAEDGEVKTRVRFTGGKITAPVAFSGSYNMMGNCMQFK